MLDDINWVEDERNSTKEEIESIKKTIKDFADKDLYSANCVEVRFLYKRLRELEGQEPIEEENYEPVFIGGSDVPINGRYE